MTCGLTASADSSECMRQGSEGTKTPYSTAEADASAFRRRALPGEACPARYFAQALRGRPVTATGDLPGALALPASTFARAVSDSRLDE